MITLSPLAKKVLSKHQQELLPLLKYFSKSYFLIGGTAISLQLGHRKSIDFDFINDTHQGSVAEFKTIIEHLGFELERKELEAFFGQEFENQDELHFHINKVRCSFFNYFRTLYKDQTINIHSDIKILGGLPSVSLEQLLCMKLFACITRNKWKDAVDIYFILHEVEISFQEALKICEEKYFVNIFNTHAVIEQCISGNWDTTESVEYLVENPPTDNEVIIFLQEEARKYISQ